MSFGCGTFLRYVNAGGRLSKLKEYRACHQHCSTQAGAVASYGITLGLVKSSPRSTEVGKSEGNPRNSAVLNGFGRAGTWGMGFAAMVHEVR